MTGWGHAGGSGPGRALGAGVYGDAHGEAGRALWEEISRHEAFFIFTCWAAGNG